ETMIRHILLIKFKGSAEPSEVKKLRELFIAMPEKVAGVVSVEWGLNDSPENLNQGYTHSVFMTFANEEGRQSYLYHPAHEALKAVFSPLLEDIIVFDYQV
ncbi:MAG: Dabb family protein, partial [Pseudohongiellaceae bacterium]